MVKFLRQFGDANTIWNIPGTIRLTELLLSGGATAGSLSLAEALANGTDKLTLIAPSSMSSDKTVTFQDVTGTVYVTGGVDVSIADGGTGASTALGAMQNLVNDTVFTAVSADTDDKVLIQDTSDSDNIKTITVSGILAPATADIQIAFQRSWMGL